ncbi:MAG TPA: hypothetical protein VFY15_06120 [Acidimicrobiia bacterium]|nr:hypothetical protein [Acidimicrobiia bacterium]
MHRDLPTTTPWVVDIPDVGRDLVLAQDAVTYLRGRGLDDQAVVQALRDEFEIDLATAQTMTLPPGGAMDLGSRTAGGSI